MVHARSFQEIIERERERAASALLPSVCATAGSLISSNDISSVSPERSTYALRAPEAALSEHYAGPTTARAPLQATTCCNRSSSAWRRQNDREPLNLSASNYGKAPTAYVRLWCLEEHEELRENEGLIYNDSVGLNVIGTRQRWSAPTTSVCVSGGAWVVQGLAAAALCDKVALLRWQGEENAAAWAEQARSTLMRPPRIVLHLDQP